ncbi:MAG: hypothetical protein ACJ748_03355 [Flavisolibacter sp.]
MKQIFKTLPFMGICFLSLSFQGKTQDPAVVVDSSLLERINALEKQVAYKKPGEEHFLMAGLATVGFASNKTTTTINGVKDVSKTNSLADVDHFEFSPMLLWRHGNKFLLEFEPSFADGGLGVNWANVSYFLTNGVIIRGGYLVLPFGTYSKRLAAGWIDKLATDPVGVADVPPTTDFGMEVEGGLQTGSMKWNYDVAISNGLQLLTDGTLQSVGITDNNRNKTITARIGWLPFSNSSLELGSSIMTGKVADAGSGFESLKANMYAFDMNLVENSKPFQINIKGQYNIIDVDQHDYENPDNSSNTYTFKNHTTSGFIQASLRPAFINNKALKNFELAGRYGNFTTPENSIWGSKSTAYSVGLDYWLNWRSVVKFTYESVKNTNTSSKDLGGQTGALIQSNSMYLQFAIQL